VCLVGTQTIKENSMANSISIQSTVTSTVDGVRTSVSSNTSTNTSSSNFLAGALDVTGSAWSDVSFSTLGDVISLTVVNDISTYSQSLVQVNSGSAGAGSPLGYLKPGEQAIIPWSGSLQGITARVVGSFVNSTYGASNIQNGKGIILFLVQES
jgi:hypothetical protein